MWKGRFYRSRVDKETENGGTSIKNVSSVNNYIIQNAHLNRRQALSFPKISRTYLNLHGKTKKKYAHA